MNGISSQKINHMDVGDFWKHNEPILEKLEHQEMPSHARMVYKDASARQDKSSGKYLTQYDLVNFYDNRKNFLKIIAQFGPNMRLDKEEILVGNSLSKAKKTIIEGSKVTNSAHIKWLCQIAKQMVIGDNLR